MIKIKSISKRALAILLAVMMLLTSGIVGTLAANVELAETGATITSTGTARLYFNMSAVSWWSATGNFAYFFNSSTNAYSWSSKAVLYSGSTYYVVIPSGSWDTVILTRNSVTSGPSWDNKWNQTGDITLSSTSNYISSFSENSTSATWGTAIKPASTASLTASATSVAPNTSVTLTPSLSSNASLNTIKSTSYSISPSTGASISGNTFTATTADTYTVTATVTYYPNGYSSLTSTATATTTITVTDPTYSYTVTAGTGGTVSPASGSVDKGESVTITATPNDGYTFGGWTVTNGTVDDATSASTTFTPTANGANATASFNINTYTVTFLNYDGTELSTQTVNHGSAAAAPTATRPGWTFAGWDTDFSNVTSDLTVTATYTEDQYTVTVNANGGTASATATEGIKYGESVTLTATATDSTYEFKGWSLDGNYVVTAGDPDTDTEITITVNSNVTATANFDLKSYSVSVSYDTNGGTVTYPATAQHGSSITLSAEAIEGYEFKGWTLEGGYEITSGSLDTTSVTITVTDNVIATASFVQLASFNYTVSANDADRGSVNPTSGFVYDGSSVVVTAYANPGYKFVNWSIVSDETYTVTSGNVDLPSIAIIPHADVTITANFEPVTGTVNVTAAEGGSVDNAGGEVTYPSTVTSTATATVEGYLFSGWTVTSEGTEDVDYTAVITDNNIVVTPLTEGVVVNVTANFNNAQKIKVYTYSADGFTSLHVTESNGTAQDVYKGTQTPVTFGDKTWYTPGELTLTAGYYEAITAQMYGSNPLSGGTGNLVIFNNTLGWDQVYLYTSSTTMWNTNTADATTKGRTAVQMQQIGSTNYYFAFVEGSFTYTLFLETENNNYDRVWQNNAAYRSDYKSTAPMFTPNTTASATASDANNQTNYYNNGSWAAAPTIPTQTNTIDITAALYNGDEWLGKEEIWLYFDSTLSAYVATDRRQLNDYVESALIKSTYNKGSNDRGYTDSSWSDFANAYEDAVSVLGAGASTQTEIDNAYTTLEAAYKALELTKTVTITGSHGAMPGFGTYYGTISFPDLTVTKNTGNIGDADSAGSSPNCEYLTATVNRDQIITINTKVNDANHVVFGWVINGTDFVSATQDIDDTTLYVGTYTCDSNAVIVPVYFRADTLKKIQSRSEEDSSKVIKVYAKADDSSTTWGNYMAAYTWTASTYKQFGRWTGQLMIPDVSSPGMYYTYVETSNPDDSTEVITGITFNNYGNNTGINADQRYQAYDYYEFIDLAAQGYDNIVFELNESDGVSNWPTKSGIDLDNNVYNFYPFVDFSGNQIDITRTALTDEQKALDTALYIVRTGPCDDLDGIGYQEDKIAGSDYYINTYVYDADGTFLVACKSFELLDLATLATNSGVDLSVYAGQPVVVDYASLTDTSGNLRYDGEWYGTKLGETKVNISVQVAYLNEDGTVTYYYDAETPNYVETVGSAYINGEASAELNHGSEGHTISASALAGNDFVGWYLATKNEDGSISIDASATPLFTEFANTIDASSDAIYVAVFEEHPVGTFTVNNYYYTYADFAGQTISPYAPPVFGGDTSYSIRDVQIKKVYDSYTDSTVTDKDLGRAGTYTQSIDAVSPGDQLEITIYTKPTYSRDYMYAWYIQSNDSYGVNFEEIGTDRAFTSADAGVEQSFTFTYTVKEGDTSITIYSDVVHITPEITLTYIYNNRYNVEQKYIVKYTLTNGELASYTPSDDTIRTNAPYVDDLYKNVEWVIENVSADAINWTLRATESDEYTINLNVDGVVATETGKFNQTVSLYASDINPAVEKAQQGLWYIENGTDGDFTAGEDEILGYGSYYGLVITEDATVYYVSDATLTNQIILADAVYGYERATDENGNVTTNKVYVDYLITNLLNVFTGGYVDVNGNGIQDANEPTVKDDVNTFTPVSLAAIEAAGYKVDYGMVLELINTFTESTRQDMIDTYYNGTHVMNTDQIKAMLDADASVWAETGYKGDTYFYSYSAKDLGATATNKNRVLMTFGYNNTESNRNRYYNAIAYLKITNSDNTETLYLFSNQAKLNIAEADKVTNS